MLMTDSPVTQVSTSLDYPSTNDEMNRLLCAAVVSKSFRNLLIASPEVAVASGYQGESFNLSDEDRNWLFSTHPTSLVDLAANMVNHQTNKDSRVNIPVKPARQYVRVS